tara:strand:- start:5938 stop:6576 length:639 start_codon:yes stop_codon:yes gene_type:complete
MKKILLSFLIVSIFSCTNNTDNHNRSEVDYSTYGDSLSLSDLKINNQLSNIKWIGSKVTESHYGTINIDRGVLQINEEGELVGGEFVIDMNSLLCTDIENEKKKKNLEDHLKNKDFFDVSNFPNSGIKITDVDKVEEESYRITADLTIKDITHSINFDADVKKQELNYEVISNIKIDRTKWDVKYKSKNFVKNLGDKFILDEIEFEVYLISQ